MPLSRSECQQYVSDRFEPLVNENDLVAPNSKVWSDTYVVLDNKKVSLNFYKSSNPEALFVDDGGVELIDTLNLDGWAKKGDEYSIEIRFHGEGFIAIVSNRGPPPAEGEKRQKTKTKELTIRDVWSEGFEELLD